MFFWLGDLVVAVFLPAAIDFALRESCFGIRVERLKRLGNGCVCNIGFLPG